jgi:hypothetical protein
MILVPDNGYLLVTRVETPCFSDIANSTICDDRYIFGNVLDTSDGCSEYLDVNVMFPRALSIPLRMKNDSDDIVDRFLVQAEDVVACTEGQRNG